VKTRFNIPTSPFSLYFEVGGGYFFFSHSLDPQVDQAVALLGITGYKEKLSGTVGGNVGIGGHYTFSDRFSLGFLISRLFASPDGTATGTILGTTISVTEKVKLGSTIIGVSAISRF
jgi:hypothetical protein